MKIVIAPDSFKESLTAIEVANTVERGFQQVFPEAQYIKLPLADGGEGTVETLLQGIQAERKYSIVPGPLGEPVKAMWALADDGHTALVELAAASGLGLINEDEKNPCLTSTYGTGVILREAIEAGARKVLLGLGGSATNDGGAGIVQALGGRLLDQSGQELSRGGKALSQLHSIDLSAVIPGVEDVEMVIACDVNNPLCGDNGATAIFGPQKGGTASQLKALDQALGQFSEQCRAIRKDFDPSTPGYGAAGGTPLGLSLLFNLQLKPGIEIVLNTLKAKEVIEGASLIITGEGQMDNQTLNGKTPLGIAQLGNAANIPVFAVAGSLGEEIEQLYPVFAGVFGTVRSPQPLPQVLGEAESNLYRVSVNLASTIKTAMGLRH